MVVRSAGGNVHLLVSRVHAGPLDRRPGRMERHRRNRELRRPHRRRTPGRDVLHHRVGRHRRVDRRHPVRL